MCARVLLQYWARHVEEAQAPNPLSSRDGRLIKPVPPELRLAAAELVGHLEEALHPLQDEARQPEGRAAHGFGADAVRTTELLQPLAWRAGGGRLT